MELYERLCKNCGGDLRQTEDGRYKCSFCGSIFEEQKVKDYAEEMHRLFDEFKLDAISNARKNLYEAVNAEYISSQLVHECCMELKKLIPDDSQACFYEIATGKNVKQITKAIRKLKVDGDADIESIIRFLIRSLQTEFQLELNNLIARAFEYTAPVKFEHYCTLLSAEAVKVDTGVYETKLPREVFVAYSSKDMEKVSELVETLEAQGLKCFVAARNLRHGKGAVENYNAALEEAMDHCRSVVFVSSTNSRSFNCDALTIELPYLQKKDLENAPAELRNNYKAIPGQYKKPRVEYRIGESTSVNVADAISNEIFDGYERAYTPEEVAARVMKQLVAMPKVEAATEPKAEPKKVKYCVSCLKECDADSKFCSVCGGSQFADTVKEAELMQKIAAMEANNDENVATYAPQSGSVEKNGLRFELNKDSKGYSVVGVAESDTTNVIIPAVFNGKPVKGIGTAAFQSCANIKSITIPASVTSIGSLAFDSCSNLESIIIPNSVTSLEYGTFASCISLSNVIIRNGIKSIGDEVFSDCTRLSSVIIPDGVISIGDCAFSDCSNLESISIPDSVTSIGGSAFWGCSSLSSVIIPNSVTSIGKSTFKGCSSLTSITVPDSVTSIGEWAFKDCTSLTSITIPDGVTSIEQAEFSGCTCLTSINIPDSVTIIRSSAFHGCSRLNHLDFKNPIGWQKAGGGLFSKIPEKILADPKKAAEALKTKYANVTIERK